MTRSASPHRTLPGAARRSLAATATVVLAALLTTAGGPGAYAASTVAGWGPQGATTAESAVTVAWNNTGNTDANTVPRDASQVLPHTGGKTYADVTASTSSAVASTYSGLRVTVGQTQQLSHQVVSLDVTGTADPAGQGALFLDAFQCWGAAGEAAPDPEHCLSGAGGIDQPQGNARNTNRMVLTGDASLVAGGDLKAQTSLLLTGDLVGTSATLTATLATTPSGTPVATGATGTVTFRKADGTLIAQDVALSRGSATTTVPGLDPAAVTGFVATYTADPSENYLPATSATLSLPRKPDLGGGNIQVTTPGATLDMSFAAGTLKSGATLSATLDNDGGTQATVGTADAFGGLDGRWTMPTSSNGTPVTSGSTHRLVLTGQGANGFLSRTLTVTVLAPVDPGTGAGTNVPNRSSDVPFQDVAGTWYSEANPTYNNATTTNELVNVMLPTTASGTSSRGFEVQTTLESTALGCGQKADAPSTGTCWLVLVPRGFTGDDVVRSPLSPSLWAQRLQVQLSFADIAPACAGGTLRTLTLGGEVLSSAMASWIPRICDDDHVSLGFSTVSEPQARAQYTAGSASAIVTSQPVAAGGDTTLYAPVGLAGVTIALRMQPRLDKGTDVLTDLKLNARLIAKLLTQSYTNSVVGIGTQIDTKAPWIYGEIRSLVDDPEFLALNPGIVFPNGQVPDLMVSITQSDATTALWNWLAGDPDAAAFLHGCPDAASGNSVINPFFSTRTYAECPEQAAALEQTASATIAATTTPATFTYTTPSYPSADGGFPQPGWVAADADTTLDELPLSLGDVNPQLASMDVVGLDVYKALRPRNTSWCTIYTCTTPIPPGQSGKWVSSATSGYYNNLGGVTTSVTSATYQNVTAKLCDDSGAHCVGATSDSLQKAAAGYSVTGGTPTLGAASIADGAYPLTLPLYAEVNANRVSATDAGALAKALARITGDGQTPGTRAGKLPPGYAPNTATMTAHAATTIAALRAIAAGTTPTATTATPTITAGSTVATVPAAAAAGSVAAGAAVAAQSGTVTVGSATPAGSTPGTPALPPAAVLAIPAGGVAAGVLAPLAARGRRNKP